MTLRQKNLSLKQNIENSNDQRNVELIPLHKNEKKKKNIKESKNTSHRLGNNFGNHTTDKIIELIIYK